MDQVFAKYDPKGTGSLDVHNLVLQLMSPERPPAPWFHDKATYEFYVLNRAPMIEARQHLLTGRGIAVV